MCLSHSKAWDLVLPPPIRGSVLHFFIWRLISGTETKGKFHLKKNLKKYFSHFSFFAKHCTGEERVDLHKRDRESKKWIKDFQLAKKILLMIVSMIPRTQTLQVYDLLKAKTGSTGAQR